MFIGLVSFICREGGIENKNKNVRTYGRNLCTSTVHNPKPMKKRWYICFADTMIKI
jgi:hypothetical protein